MKGPRPLACPWCGRDIVLSPHGLAPRHKRPEDKGGAVSVPWCAGGGELPLTLSAAQNGYLRTQWQDSDGNPIPLEDD